MRVIWPEYISLKDWSAALVFDYFNEPLPILTDEEKWAEWGAIVAGTGIFARTNIPSPITITKEKREASFKEWKEWAKVVYSLMANEKH